jgi:hypothetical protein
MPAKTLRTATNIKLKITETDPVVEGSASGTSRLQQTPGQEIPTAKPQAWISQYCQSPEGAVLSDPPARSATDLNQQHPMRDEVSSQPTSFPIPNTVRVLNPKPMGILDESLVRERELLLNEAEQLLTKDLPEDVRKTLRRDDAYQLTPDGLEKAPTWKKLQDVFCERAGNIAELVYKFAEPRDHYRRAKEEIESCKGEVLKGDTSSIAWQMCAILYGRWQIGLDSSQGILQRKLNVAIKEAERQIVLALRTLELNEPSAKPHPRQAESLFHVDHKKKLARLILDHGDEKPAQLLARFKKESPGLVQTQWEEDPQSFGGAYTKVRRKLKQKGFIVQD